jgi:Zn-dependent peptidase ImmA (M78 family)
VRYKYRRRSEAELRRIANKILETFPTHRLGDFAVDIEKIQESLGLEIIFRPNFGALPVAGYAAQDPNYIVLNELQLVYLPRARFTIAEEVSHKILEWDLWQSSKIPEGAHAHHLTDKQHQDIEENARSLAAEILEPAAIFKVRFNHHHKQAEEDGKTGNALIKSAARSTGEDFMVSDLAAAYRAKKLGLLTAAEYRGVYPPVGLIL